MMKKISIVGALAAAAALALVATGCTSSTPAATDAATSTLRMALSGDMSTLDPTTVYQFEGNQVLTAVYEGLLEYAGDSSSEIVPLLAESYTISDDGLVYTFTLRDDVTFADGTVMDSAAVQKSFERLTDEQVGSQMSYMLAGVTSYETPDASTFVINLGVANSSFITLIASPFGPKVIDPAVLEENAADSALDYLSTNTAGTGPYEVTSFTEGQEYVLTRNDDYWGDEPYYETVSFKIIPDAATQVLQLQGGDLDIISGQPITTVQSFAGNDEFQIQSLPTLLKAQVHLKVTGPLADQELREALRAAIDRPTLVTQIWGDYATESTQMYPVNNVPEGESADGWDYDPAALEALADGQTLTLGYGGESAQDKQVAETLQTAWEAAGFTIELVPMQGGEQYGYSSDIDSAPDMVYESAFPDSTHPDTWSRLFWYSDTSMGSGVLNYLLGGTPDADALMDEGLVSTDEAAATAAYGEAGDLIYDQASYITLADLQDTFIVRSGITGFDHWLPSPRTLQLKTLSE
jgi:peptide/nickel transport system substrate-binding protein